MIKESIHQLVEELPEEELSTALRFLQYLKDVGGADHIRPMIQELDDDEYEYDDYEDEPMDPLSEEDEGRSVADAWQQYLNNRPRP